MLVEFAVDRGRDDGDVGMRRVERADALGRGHEANERKAPRAVVLQMLVAVVTGSSWTTAGTVGIAMIGIAAAFGLNLGIAA